MSKPTKGAGTNPAGASRGRPATEAPSQERANVIYNGQYVRVRERNGFYNAYVRNNPELSQVDLVARALKELVDNREKIEADGIIWLRAPGFRIGVPPDKRVIIVPNFRRKAILFDNVVKFVKRYESKDEDNIHN